MNRWFRMYEEILDDPKVQKLSPELFKMWVNILALASRHNGILPSLGDCAFAFRVTEESVSIAFHELEKNDLLKRKNGSFQPKGWDKRQYKSDTSTDRVKRFRQRSRNTQETPSEAETDTELTPLPPAGGFDEFWNSYPNKIDEGAARKAFAKATAKAPLSEILEGVRRYIAAKPASVNWKKPAGWLDAERWRDNPATPTPGKPPSTASPAASVCTYAEMVAKREKANPPPPITGAGIKPAALSVDLIRIPVEGSIS